MEFFYFLIKKSLILKTPGREEEVEEDEAGHETVIQTGDKYTDMGAYFY
ncbi:hypothetical protein GCM10020331_021370 [Ectobacillus funiculus]